MHDGEVVGRNPMALAKGKSLLAAKQVAVLRYVSPALLQHSEFVSEGKEQFLKDLARICPEDCYDIAERDITLFEVKIAQMGQDGISFLRESALSFPFCHRAAADC